MELRQSTFDPNFWEILSDGKIIQEIAISFPLIDIPTYFDSLQEIFSWLEQKETKLVKNAALNLLARRSYTKAMLLKKLKEKKFSEEKSRIVIEECEKLGYLSDNDYAQRLLEQKIRQGYGARYIEQYFRTKGLDPKLAQIDLQTEKQAMKKWEAKLKGKSELKRKVFLLRKGFNLNILYS